MIHKPLSKRESSCAADLDDFSFDSESEMIEFARSRNFVEIASDDRILNKNIAADDLLFQRTTDEQRIRDYCLLMKQQQGSEAYDIAKDLHKNTQYHIRPNMTRFPPIDQPKESKETRRALLQTLSPLLTQAENVRKNDQEIIEDFTRCNIERVRHKDYGYQYTDIDNGNYVAPSEYEKRYLLHLSKLKADSKLSPRSFVDYDLSNAKNNQKKKSHLANFVLNSNGNHNMITAKNNNYEYSYNDENIPHNIIKTLSNKCLINDENSILSQSLCKQSITISNTSNATIAIPRPRPSVSALLSSSDIAGKIVRKPFTPHNSSSTLPSYSCLAILDPSSSHSPTSYPLTSNIKKQNNKKQNNKNENNNDENNNNENDNNENNKNENNRNENNENYIGFAQREERMIFKSMTIDDNTNNNMIFDNPSRASFPTKSIEKEKLKIETTTNDNETVNSSTILTNVPSFTPFSLPSPRQRDLPSIIIDSEKNSYDTRFLEEKDNNINNNSEKNKKDDLMGNVSKDDCVNNVTICSISPITTKNLIVSYENPDTNVRTIIQSNTVLMQNHQPQYEHFSVLPTMEETDRESNSVTHPHTNEKNIENSTDDGHHRDTTSHSSKSLSNRLSTKVTIAILNLTWSTVSHQATRVGKYLSKGKILTIGNNSSDKISKKDKKDKNCNEGKDGKNLNK